ncbi:hypothetical protein Xcaj_22865 [Xanthomonas axonopodis pv. cajani]|uniref:UDP-N-acetylmuramoyl-tripeptide--D-alanyl-D-alanine ligase n=1 Tax=Xanthomonas axonopodis pv. cajani TaxID=487827 RepID=A0ABX3MEA1_9XANT|nr:hypothetical protein Xcaj_22865 [Xanthomonas axonopodis pv. cajani]
MIRCRGAEGVALHAAAGRRARAAKLQRLYALGELSAAAAQAFGEGGRVFATHAELIDALQADLVGAASQLQQMQQHASGNTQEHAVNQEQQSPSVAALSGAASITILVKGSRGSAMDRVVTALLASAEGASHAA